VCWCSLVGGMSCAAVGGACGGCGCRGTLLITCVVAPGCDCTALGVDWVGSAAPCVLRVGGAALVSSARRCSGGGGAETLFLSRTVSFGVVKGRLSGLGLQIWSEGGERACGLSFRSRFSILETCFGDITACRMGCIVEAR
jgi:hypothetical protein